MSGDREWSRIRPLLKRMLESPPKERDAILDAHCGGDEALRRRVLRMLEQERADVGFLEASPPPDFAPGRRLGPWRLTRLVGGGGMGGVWEAERADGEFEKSVALKIIRTDIPVPGMAERFEAERRVLARLEHANIARLLDGGTAEGGIPWLAMEYVDGAPIDHYCDEHRLDVGDRLELFRGVCDAVRYAHRSLVVHRDLKPSNILVDRDGTPKLLDFGIAKLLRADGDAGAPDLTRPGQMAFTPRYASPEQVRGEPVTTATDVYSLGVVLYELLTGRHSYELDESNPISWASTVCEHEPRRPSAVVVGENDSQRRSELRSSTPRRLSKRLAGDLDTIVASALQKEPERRYASVEQLDDDLRRHRQGLPVLARPDTLAYRTMKYVRRHRVPVAAALVVFVALVAATVVSLGFAVESGRQRDEANQARERSDELFRALLDRSLDAALDAGVRVHHLAGGTAISVDMMARSVEDLEVIERQAGGDPAVLARIAEAYTRLGDRQGNPAFPNVGDVEGARESYRRALTLAEGLPADDPEARRVLAICHRRLGELAHYQRDVDEAERHFDRSLALYRELEAESGDRSTRLQLAIAHDKLATVYNARGRPDAERDSFQRYHEQVLALRQEYPDDVEVAFQLALSHQRLGGHAGRAGDYDTARDHYRNAGPILEHLAEEGTENATHRTLLAWNELWVGDAELTLGRHDAAEEALSHSASMYRELFEADPENIQLGLRLGAVIDMLGNLERVRAQAPGVTDPEAHWRAGLAQYQRAHEVWNDLLESGRLPPHNARLLDMVREKITECEGHLPID